MDLEAELWLQRLKQLEEDIQAQRNDLEFQKFCYRCVIFSEEMSNTGKNS